MNRRSPSSRGRALPARGSRDFLRALLAPLIALSVTTCADASREPQDGAVAPSQGDALPCNAGGECAHGLRCVDGLCVEPCRAAESLEGSIGCGFWASTPDIRAGSEGACFAAYVVNASSDPIAIEVAFGGQKLDTYGKIYVPRGSGSSLTYQPIADRLAPNDLAIIFLSELVQDREEQVRCPTGTRALLTTVDSAVHGTGRGRAFSITTSGPASAYSIYPYGGAPSFYPTATMLLPSGSFGTEYIAVDAWESATFDLKPYIQVLGTEDDTKVTMTPVADIEASSDVLGASAGVPQTWSLAKGEVLQLVAPKELMGSPIVADKPVGLFGGSRGMQIPTGQCCVDVAQQQIPPVRRWGREVPAVTYRSRAASGTPESVPWRVVAAAAGTELTYEPTRPEGAPSVLGKGEHALFWSTAEFVVRSQDDDHPIYVSAHMTGGDSFSPRVGDPEFVNVVPTAQFLDRYVFLTDPTYKDTNLVIVRARTSSGFRDVVLGCAGAIEGWRPLGKDLEFARVDVTLNGTPQLYRNGAGACDHGRHEMRSEGPFSVTVWGWDDWASYAFTGGSGTRTINEVVLR